MSGKYSTKRKRRSRSTSPIILLLISVMIGLILFSLGLRFILNTGTRVPVKTQSEVVSPSAEIQEPPKAGFWQRLFGSSKDPAPEEPPIPHRVQQAQLTVTGDILMHMPVINSGLASDGSYRFSSIFQYLSPYTEAADLAAANLETTLSGSDAGYKYSGYPAFNCPDAIVDALKEAGFDALLTANNHCYDTSEYGFLRTVNTVRQKGLTVLGTRAREDEPRYTIADINGIRVGLVCYTYEGQPENPTEGIVYMNRNAMTPLAGSLINSFLESQPDRFYMEVRRLHEQMLADGAEATVIFMHWGIEYQTAPNFLQKQIAQNLCDIGFDVIIGGHPHVIQPVSLLTSSTDPEQKTVCLYSTGNAVSNQRISEMDLKTGHTEDGVLFTVRFARWSDGSVYLEDVQLLPLWVDLRQNESGMEYVIIPLDLDNADSWQDSYSLSDEALANAHSSYDRTLAITGDGISQVQEWLGQQQDLRENPEHSTPPLSSAA